MRSLLENLAEFEISPEIRFLNIKGVIAADIIVRAVKCVVETLIMSDGWNRMGLSNSSPFVVSSDYHMFLHFKKHLGGQGHKDDEQSNHVAKVIYQAADIYKFVELIKWINGLNRFSRVLVSLTVDSILIKSLLSTNNNISIKYYN